MMKNNMYLNYSIYLLIYVRIMNLIYALINNLSLPVSLSLSLSIAISDSSTYAEGEGVRCCHDACFIEDSAVTGAYLLLLSSRQAWQEAVPFPTQWLYNSCGIICRELLITYYIIPNIYIYYVCVCASYIFSQGFQGACPISYMNAQIVTTSPHTSTYCISLTFTARRIFRELKPKAALIKPELGIQLALPQGWRLPKVVLFWSDLPSRRPKPGAGDLRWPCWQSTLQVGNQLLFNSVL